MVTRQWIFYTKTKTYSKSMNNPKFIRYQAIS